MADEFTPYEVGMKKLLEQLGKDHTAYDDALTFQQRLTENIDAARTHGDTETLRHERSQIMNSLNRLAQMHLNVSFNDLCESVTSRTTRLSRLFIKEKLKTRRTKAIATVILLLAGAVLLAVALAVIQWPGLSKRRNQSVYPSEVVILVAEFSEGATREVPTDRTVTHKILTELRRLEDVDPRLVIIELGQVILDPDTALGLGQEKGAVVVIWGTYTRSPTCVWVEPHFRVVSPPIGVLAEGYLREPEERVVDIKELESFTLHLELSQEMTYLSAFVAGLINYWQKNFDQAISDFDAALGLVARSEQSLGLESVHYYKGLIFRQQGRYAEAEKGFRESVGINPMFVEGYNALGLTLDDQGRIDQAVEQCWKAIEADPQFASAYNNLAVAYGVQGKPVDVRIELYLKALDIEPANFMFHRNLGSLYQSQDRYDEALVEYQEAIEAYPYDADSYYFLADLYVDLAKWAEARQACSNALELDPAHAAAHNLLGILYSYVGDSDRAVAEYMRALEIEPDYASAHSNLGLQCEHKGKLDLAQAEYEKALILKPDEPLYKCRLGVLHRRLERIEEGDDLIAECERLVALQPEDATGHNELGIAYMEQEKFDQALLEFQQSIRLDSNNHIYYSNLSSVYEEQGQLQRAVEEAEKALRLSPDPFSAHLDLLALHWAARDYREVAKELAFTWLAASVSFKLSTILLMVFVLGVAYVLKDSRRSEKAMRTTVFLGLKCALATLLATRRVLVRINTSLQASGTSLGQPSVSQTLIRVNHLTAVCYYRLGNMSTIDDLEEDALEKWHKALSIDPGYLPAAHELINFYLGKDNLLAACRIARQATRTKSGDAIMHIRLGDIYMSLNMTEEAIREWENAVKIDVDAVIKFRFEQLRLAPLLVPAHFTLGLAFRAKKEIDKALRGFEISISSTHNRILKHMAETEIQALRATQSGPD